MLRVPRENYTTLQFVYSDCDEWRPLDPPGSVRGPRPSKHPNDDSPELAKRLQERKSSNLIYTRYVTLRLPRNLVVPLPSINQIWSYHETDGPGHDLGFRTYRWHTFSWVAPACACTCSNSSTLFDDEDRNRWQHIPALLNTHTHTHMQ